MKFITNNPWQTKKLGEKFAERILKEKLKKRAFVIGLEGDLGGGKTTFLQGFAKGLGIKEKILSPTFIIFRRFKIPRRRASTLRGRQSLKFKVFYHIDCYRIQKPKEILALGFKEIISDSKNLVAIEWVDRIRKILPKDTLILKFQFVNKNKRKIVFWWAVCKKIIE